MGEPLKIYYCTPLKHRGPAASGINRRTHDGYWKVTRGAIAIMSNEGGDIRRIPLKPRDEIGAWNAIEEIRAMEGEGFTTAAYEKIFTYKKGRIQGQSTKWAMREYTLHHPESGQENRSALCYVYKTKQDGRQGNGNGKVNPQQPTDHHVGGGSSISASVVAVGGSPLFELPEIPLEFKFYTPEELLAFVETPLCPWDSSDSKNQQGE